ncbi:response regulator [Thermodesulfobacteriota bacterium]
MNVLLVDDEEKFVSILAERLSIRGIDTDWATNGLDALSMVKKKKYDVAILDVKMPQMSGIELKREFEKIDPAMKYILVTGHGSSEEYTKGIAEASFYIIKPFKIDFLIEKIREVMGT